MASWSRTLVSLTIDSRSIFSSSTSSPIITPPVVGSRFCAADSITSIKLAQPCLYSSISKICKNKERKQICRAGEYKFPDPIPEFADAEAEKFRTHLHKKLVKKDICGDSVDDVVRICTEIFSTFLHTEYGGPGTLLVTPFIDMADTINERGLPGGPQAARAAVKWAQDHVDKDWKEWTGGDSN
ncbi:hypothetical protein JCGZ_21773 [Jatropha curcas]|uniref:Uncharacterized protein n=1 Tax=Jatropha curcas TaxID=180498 RepID=A0A067JBY9_JATCU|nr:protein PLASTID REDOX INSENSITIVE 2, chloroplastic [Jatropha curcas]KDP21302.1 hypothetical protein JCGZ_21773 [Jatropha curcas]